MTKAPMPPRNPRPRGRPRGTLTALSPLLWIKLNHELRRGPGPINLSATAKAYGISRSTLERHIDREPGLREAIEARREAEGRGYRQTKRGTRDSRAAAKARLAERLVSPPLPLPDMELPPVIRERLAKALDEFGAFERWAQDQSELPCRDTAESIRAKVAATLKRRAPAGPPDRDQEEQRRLRAAWRPFTGRKKGE